MRRAALAHVLARRPIFCCSTSRPTISICPPSNGSKARSPRSAAALVLISHDRRFLENLSRTTVWLDRGKSAPRRAGLRRLRGLARRAARRGGGRAAQARPQDRRRGALGALRRDGPAQAQRAAHGGAAEAAAIAARSPQGRRQGRHRRGAGGKVGRARHRGQRHLQGVRAPARSSTTFPAASCAGTASASSAPTAAARRPSSGFSPARLRPTAARCGSAPSSRWRRWSRAATASIPIGR